MSRLGDVATIASMKRCRAGSTLREITDEEPAPGEPARQARPKRPEPIGALAEPEGRFAPGGSAVTNATTERPLAPASVVRSVGANMVDGVLRVVVVTDGAVQFKDFILSGPSRIVVDLAGVRSTMGSKTVAVAAGLVDCVSSVWVVTVWVAAERLERHRRTQLPL